MCIQIIVCLLSMLPVFIQTEQPSPAPTIDQQNMFNAIYSFPEQLTKAMQIGKRITLTKTYEDINHIVFAGMGGSGIAGDIASLLVQDSINVPITVVKNYALPHWVNNNTLVILISYSGNTQETLSCFDDAQKKKAHIFGITSGGTLFDKLLQFDYDYLIVPTGYAPRAALGYLTVPSLYIMNKIELIDNAFEQDIQCSISQLKAYRQVLSKKHEKNSAYIYAQHFKQFMPVIYGTSEKTICIARRWQTQFAENSKMLAHLNALPELNHNEIVGWKNNIDLLKRSVIVWLLDSAMHEQNKKRQQITKELIGKLSISQLEFQGDGASLCERTLFLIHLGDWISYWCALEHKSDPTPVTPIDELKTKMQES